jgi:thioredoxin reductase (NADPH)
MLTNLPGVMAAGDIINKDVRQVVNGAGEGAVAAMSAEHFLASQG